MFESMNSVHAIRQERWRPRDNEADRNRLFEGLQAENDDAPEKHIDDAKGIHHHRRVACAGNQQLRGWTVPCVLY